MGWNERQLQRQIVERAEIGGGTAVRKAERALAQIEVALDEPQDGTEVVIQVVDVARRGIGRDKNQRNAEAHLVGALRRNEDRRRDVVVPSAPIVPGHDDRCRIPIAAAVRIFTGTRPEGVDDARHPCRAAQVAAVIGVVSIWNGPVSR